MIKTDSDYTSQRKYPRKIFKKPVAYLCHGKSAVVIGLEIGEGGLSFESDEQLQTEQNIVVNFFVPGGDFFSLQTTIKSAFEKQDQSNKMIYGVHFNNMNLSLKRQIRAYVARMSLNEQKSN